MSFQLVSLSSCVHAITGPGQTFLVSNIGENEANENEGEIQGTNYELGHVVPKCG